MDPELFNSIPLEERYLLVREHGEPFCTSDSAEQVRIFYVLEGLYIEVVITLKGLEPISVKALLIDDPEMETLIKWIWLSEIDEFCEPDLGPF
jgi:hypothetical protein